MDTNKTQIITDGMIEDTRIMLFGQQAARMQALFSAAAALLDVAQSDHDYEIEREGKAEADYHENDCSACRALRDMEEALGSART